MIKTRYIYTVIREDTLKSEKELKTDLEFLNGMKEEAGEYLYGGSYGREKINLVMQYSKDNGKTWQTA